MKLRIAFVLIWVPLLAAAGTKTVHQWEVFTLSMKSGRSYTNPYQDIPVTRGNDLLKVTFRGTGGNALNKEVTIVGFWTGGKEWRVNFAAPESGSWTYSSSSTDRSLNGIKGKIEVIPWTDAEKAANPARHGFVRVNKKGPEAGHYFEYSDGTPFLWIGDTWWNWTDIRIRPETFKQLVDDRAGKGFNVGQLFVPGNGWGRESSLLDETYTIPDTAHLQKTEQMIRYANSKGITVWIHGWWSRKDMDKSVGREKMIRWWRYLVHRFSAYNVIWVLAGEYNMYDYGGLGVGFWKDLGQLIKDEDPYERIVSLHNTPPFWDGGADAPQWSTTEILHQEPWLDYNQSQVGHGKFANEMIPSVIREAYNMKPAKPIVVTESWYEFREGNAPAMDIRFAAWSSILSGAAGHTYGGGHVWLASVPEAPSDGAPWPYEKGFANTTYDYQGAKSIMHLATFFRNVTWWKMSPHPELVKEYPQPLCLADPGKEYIVYLRYGGTVKVDLSTSSGELFYQWFDPSSGKLSDKIQVKGEGIKEFNSPGGYPESPEYKDWVLYIRSK